MTKTEQFKEITKQMATVQELKAEDYGDTYAEMFDEYGMQYGVIMMEQKLKRIKSVLNRKNINFESLDDSLLDLANYAILFMIEEREKEE